MIVHDCTGCEAKVEVMATKANRDTLEPAAVGETDHKLWVDTCRTFDVMGRERAKELGRIGVSEAEGRVLWLLATSNGAATPAEITKWSDREPRSTRRLLRAMEEKGLVAKVDGGGRGNQQEVRLTEKGQEEYEQWLSRESLYRALSPLSRSEKLLLERVIRLVLQASIEGVRGERVAE